MFLIVQLVGQTPTISVHIPRNHRLPLWFGRLPCLRYHSRCVSSRYGWSINALSSNCLEYLLRSGLDGGHGYICGSAFGPGDDVFTSPAGGNRLPSSTGGVQSVASKAFRAGNIVPPHISGMFPAFNLNGKLSNKKLTQQVVTGARGHAGYFRTSLRSISDTRLESVPLTLQAGVPEYFLLLLRPRSSNSVSGNETAIASRH